MSGDVHVRICERLGVRLPRATRLVLGIGSSGTSDGADNLSSLDQMNAASRRDESIEREQVVEVHKVDTIFEDLGWAPKGRGCACFVLGNLNGGEHRAVHPLEGN